MSIPFLNYFVQMALDMAVREKEMQKEFKRRAELDRQKYWDACKHPRKTKKRMRKEAQDDYNFHITLCQQPIYSF